MKGARPQLKDIPAKTVLRQQRAWWNDRLNKDRVWTYDAFPQWPPKLVLRKMEQLVSSGHLEYGVSLRTAWLTEKGSALIG